MKQVVSIFMLILMVALQASYGEDLKFDTGDAEFDTALTSINTEAGEDTDEFADSLSETFSLPKAKIIYLLTKGQMSPADVYLTLKIASDTKRKVADVLKEYKKSRKKGWRVIARNLGIKPGSKAFHVLKNGGLGQLEKIRTRKKGKARVRVKPKAKGGKKWKAKGRGKKR